jgi:hypothetical protein
LGRVDEARRVPGIDLATAYRFAAQVLFTRGSYSEAARVGLAGLELRPEAGAAYEVACALARAGDGTGAVKLLNRATDLGFSDSEYALTDADLATVHALPAFADWVQRVKNRPADKTVT